MSEFRIEKARVAATIHVVGKGAVRGAFFVGPAPSGGAGHEPVADLLNDGTGFVPFELDGAVELTTLYNRVHVVRAQLHGTDEVTREAGYAFGAVRRVRVRLSDGSDIIGTIRVYRPRGSDRVSDWARGGEPFRYVETDAGVELINLAHVVELVELPTT